MQTSGLQRRLEAFPELPEQKRIQTDLNQDQAMGLTPRGSRAAASLIITHPLQNNFKKGFFFSHELTK